MKMTKTIVLCLIALIVQNVQSSINMRINKNGQQDPMNKLKNFILQFGIEIPDFTNQISDKNGDSMVCKTCELLIESLHNKFKNETKITNDLIKIAEFLGHLIIDTAPFAVDGVIEQTIPLVIDNLFIHYTDYLIICPLLKACPSKHEAIDIKKLTAEIIKDKPNLSPPQPKFNDVLNIMHISDLHVDPLYQEGTPTKCDFPICCRANVREKDDSLIDILKNWFYGKSEHDKKNEKAGFWGAQGSPCDIPFRTINKFGEFLNRNVSVDFAIWTGDNTPHDIWNQSIDSNIDYTVTLTQILQNITPNITYYPIAGNHESYPVNAYDPFSNRENKMKETFANIWQTWIGKEAANQYRKLGYYQVYLPNYNLKIISINTQTCNPINWFLLRNPTDPDGQLQWLRDQLYESESKGQFVYIFGHILTNNCNEDWAQVYSALIDRFSYIIRAQFFGHTHFDQFELFRSLTTNETVGVQFVSPSMTTEQLVTPSFRVFQVDKDTMIPLDYKQFRLNLTKWNQFDDDSAQLEWDVAYQFLQEYNLSNIYQLENLDKLAERIRYDKDTYKKYVSNFHTGIVQQGQNLNDDDDEIDQHYFCQINPIPSGVDRCNNNIDFYSIGNRLVMAAQGSWKNKTK